MSSSNDLLTAIHAFDAALQLIPQVHRKGAQIGISFDQNTKLIKLSASVPYVTSFDPSTGALSIAPVDPASLAPAPSTSISSAPSPAPSK